MYVIPRDIKVLFLGFALLVSSCSADTSIKSLNTPTNNPSLNPTSDIAISPSASVTSTLFEIPKQETDGRLSLIINKVSDRCYAPGEVIPLILIYKNLTQNALRIAGYDILSIHPLIDSEGQLYPFVFYQTGEEIITPEHLKYVQVASMEEKKTYILNAGEDFKVQIRTYAFPLLIIVSDTTKGNIKIPTPSGNYLIQIKYLSQSNNSYWGGVISSNAINVCIK